VFGLHHLHNPEKIQYYIIGLLLFHNLQCSSHTNQRNVIIFTFKDQGVLDTWRWWWHIPPKCQGSVTLLLSITWILNISAAGTSIFQIILHHVLYSILMNKPMHEATCIWFICLGIYTNTFNTDVHIQHSCVNKGYIGGAQTLTLKIWVTSMDQWISTLLDLKNMDIFASTIKSILTKYCYLF